MAVSDNSSTHLTAEQVAAYLDRALSSGDRASVETHLARCPECRHELLVAAGLLRARPWWRSWYVWAPAAGAAAALALLIAWPSVPQRVAGPVLRSGDEGIHRFSAVQPAADVPVATDSLVFIWRSAGPEAHYQVTVAEAAGDPVWRGEIGDTVLVLPVELRRGAMYFWYVDALLPDGETATTGVQRFRTLR